jgi:hypothetical protein
MTQATLDDDELFTEAASEMREDVETSLEKAREALPDAESVWEVESDNTLGVLNALRSALDIGDAREHLRDAKKWFTMGKEADAFEDGEDLAEEIEAVEALLTDIEDASEQVGELTSTIPQLKSALEEATDEADTDADADTAEAEA